MLRAQSSRGLARGPIIALLGVAVLILPSSAVAMRAAGTLSPRLAKLASPALRDASPAQQARAIGFAPDRLAHAGRRPLVDVRFDHGALGARGALRRQGARVIAASGRYQTVTAAVPPARLRSVAAITGVRSVTPVLAPILAAATCPSGAVVSEGDEQLRARQAREEPPEPDGSGVTVGILSDSFDQAPTAATHAREDVESGDLPGENECDNKAEVVEVAAEEEGEPTDEGRAMAQIVHDLAPGAALEFASAFNGETAFAENIHALAEAGAEVIADDVFYPGEPFFQDGPIAVAVKEVTEDEGVTYFSAAGNDNIVDAEGHDIGSWETPEYRDSGGCPPTVRALAGTGASDCLDFNPDEGALDKTFGIKVQAGGTLAIDLQWDEPWEGVETDLDAYLLNSIGGVIRQSAESNLSAQVPVEYLEWTNTSSSTKTVQLVVNRPIAGPGDPAVKLALLENGEASIAGVEYPRSSGDDVVGPTIFGHSGSAAAISTGAVFFGDPTEPEEYSSRGPVRHDFGQVEGEGSGPAAELPAPEELSKPDLVATDCGRTTFFSFFLEVKAFPIGWYFCGTSAAAPHAAAVAALLREVEPAAEPQDIRDALVASANPSSFDQAYGPCDVGAGLVDAVAAIEAIFAPPGGTPPVCESPASEVEPEDARAPGDWGSETPPPPPPPPPSPPNGGGSSPPSPSPPEEQPPVTPRPPRTFILRHPLKVIHTARRRALAVFRFGSNESGVSFFCRIDGRPFRPCSARLARRFPPGRHLVAVVARDAEGLADRSPARYRFRVRAIR